MEQCNRPEITNYMATGTLLTSETFSGATRNLNYYFLIIFPWLQSLWRFTLYEPNMLSSDKF